MTDSYMAAQVQGIGKLIEERRLLAVPDHQRDFAWNDDDEVTTFLEDVERAMAEGRSEYFIGLIVLVKPKAGGAWEVLDGQQRLATTTMVYAGIREWLYGAGFAGDASKVQNRFIGVSDLGVSEDRARITLNVNDRQAFHELVVNRSNDARLADRLAKSARHSSVRRLIAAAIACRAKVAAFASKDANEPADQAARLFKLATYLRDNVTVVVMELASTANAYVVFEALNDRGLDLSVLDLIKNHLFGRGGAHLQEVQANWMKMTANLGDRPSDDFLKVFWTSKHGRIQRGRLFDEWRQLYGAKGVDVVAVSDELANAADLFAALDAPDHEAWAAYSKESKDLVRDLAILGNQQIRPVVLAAMRSYTPERVERLLAHLQILIVRFQTVGKGRTGLLEIACARLAKGIATGELKSPQSAWNDIAYLVPNDEDFRQAFMRYNETNALRARYVLGELERTASRGKSGRDQELVPSDALSLEHVLPRNPGNEWSIGLKGRELRELALMIGNLCLLDPQANRQMGSKGFTVKRDKLYASSSLILTHDLASYEDWNSSTIAKRQERLAALAVSTWPLPPANL